MTTARSRSQPLRTGAEGGFASSGLRLFIVLLAHVALIVWVVNYQPHSPQKPTEMLMEVRMIVEAAPEPEPIRPQPAPTPEPVVEPPEPPEPPKPTIEPPPPAPKPVARPVKRPAKPVKERVVAAPVAEPVSEPSPVPTQPAEAEPPPPPAPAAAVAEVPAEAAPARPVVSAARFDADYLRNPKPAYPLFSRRRGEEGTVLLLVDVSAEGTASQVRLHRSSGYPRLDDAAIAAVREWRFVPARRGDEAIASSVVVPIAFGLDR
jgi:protein TonB